MKTSIRTILALGAMTALTASLSACGPKASQQAGSNTASAAPAAPSDWSMADLARVDPQAIDSGGPLPQALPMQAADESNYSPAPSFDYAPQSPGADYAPLNESYYVSNPGSDDYALLALAASLGGMLGDAPPDYAFAYDGVQPWAWQTGSGYIRYAEPVAGGYRYYYYAPHADRPFLVRDPYYSYGYRDGQLAVIYDRDGRIVDAQKAQRERQAAQSYFARAEQLYRAAQHDRHQGVSAPRWQRQQSEIARAQQQWSDARRQRPAWQQWDAHNEPQLKSDWASEAVVRRQAATSFADWQKADFRTPPPHPYTRQQRQADLQRVADIRRQEQAQRSQLAQRASAQRQVNQQQQAEGQNLAQQRQQIAQQQQHQKAQSRQLNTQQAQLQAQHQAQLTDENRIAQQKAAATRQQKAAATRQQHAAEQQAQQARMAAQRSGQAMQAAQHKAQQAAAAAQEARQTQQVAQQRAQQAKATERQAEQAKAANDRAAVHEAQQKRQAEQAQQAAERKAQSGNAAGQAAQYPQAQVHAAKPSPGGRPSPKPTGNSDNSKKNKHDHGRG